MVLTEEQEQQLKEIRHAEEKGWVAVKSDRTALLEIIDHFLEDD